LQNYPGVQIPPLFNTLKVNLDNFARRHLTSPLALADE
jgi:hypothetical protein